MCFYFLGVPTVPLLPPQVNQSLTSVPPMNPTTTLPSLMPLPAGLPNLPNLPNLNLPAPHIMLGVGLPELMNPGLPLLPSLPPRNLPGIAPLPMPSEFLPSFPLVPEGSATASSGELLSSLPPTSSPPSDPLRTTAKSDAVSSLTVDVIPPLPRPPPLLRTESATPPLPARSLFLQFRMQMFLSHLNFEPFFRISLTTGSCLEMQTIINFILVCTLSIGVL
jgi:hypothetical protein